MNTIDASSFFRGPLLMRPEVSHALCSTLRLMTSIKLDGTGDRGVHWMAGGRSKAAKTVAVMGLYGMIDKRRSWVMDFMGGTSTDEFGMVFDALVADPSVKGIVIDADTPGGSSVGVMEAGRKIFEARGSKPIVAVSNSEMNSAGYWIGSAASRVFVSPSSGTGSIGVWSAAAEYSKQLEQDGVKVHVWRSEGSPNKASFLPWQEFSAEAIADEQMEVDRIYGEFREAVARHRGVTQAVAQKNFGQGKVMGAEAAVAAGLADRVATIDEVVARMHSGRLSLNALNDPQALAAAFEEEIVVDESWRDVNASERMRSELRRKGVLN